MAFTKGTANFTNGSKAVTNVSLTSGQLAYFASGTAVFVQSQGQLIEATGLPKDGNGDVIPNQFLLRGNWIGPTGSYDFVAFDTIEGLRDAVQSARGFSEQLQAFVESAEVNPVANSFVQRTSNGRVKAALATEVNDAVTLGQTGDAYSRNVGTNDDDLLEVGAAGVLRANVSAETNFNNYPFGQFFISGIMNSSINRPPISGGRVSGTTFGSASYGGQIAISPEKEEMAFRGVKSGSFQQWRELWHTGNFTPGAASSRNVGTANSELAEYILSSGLSGAGYGATGGLSEQADLNMLDKTQFISTGTAYPANWDNTIGQYPMGIHIQRSSSVQSQMAFGYQGFAGYRVKSGAETWSSWRKFWDSANTAVDGNGFIKEASPIIRLYADHIDEILEPQGALLNKVGVGHYRIEGTLGFAPEGWYIETPKDANGIIKFITEYDQLDDNTIIVKTYEPTGSGWKPEKGDPVDISEDRWIDIRLKTSDSELEPEVTQVGNESV